MAYQKAIQYLESFINYEKIASYPYRESCKLERIKDFLAAIGDPQEALRCIHVAGTKGKGSTCAFISYILREAGFRVGLYTSPHLSDFRERIRILERQNTSTSNPFEGMITKRGLTAIVDRLKPAIDKYNKISKYGPLSFFEVYTALAFVYFKEQQTDFVVLETGLGGRLDATNTVNALVSVITPISYEHTDKLGSTLAEIAGEKAGIIKGDQGIRGSGDQAIVISAPQEEEARDVIRNRCKEAGATLCQPKIRKLKIKLYGDHQQVNANVALAAVRALKIGISGATIRRGLQNTVWPGRCEIVSKYPLVVLDGAQNVASAKAIKEAVRKNFKYKKLILILGISKDKDIKGICSELYDLADEVILTRADNPRATKPEDLRSHFKNKKAYLTKSVLEAKRFADKFAMKKDLLLVTGSLFVVGEARNAWRRKR
jgi:dihydrofolate synthase/folylpolyglutamate synthase